MAVHNSWGRLQVVFITAFEEYAIQAIKFSALDYILKPIDAEDLQVSLKRAISKINSKFDDSVLQ